MKKTKLYAWGAALFSKVNGLKEVLYGFKNDKATEFADRLFVEKG